MISDSGPGTAGFTCSGATGTRVRWSCSSRSGSPAPNGGAPVASSYSVAPTAYRSARSSTARPVRPVCSGARYARVPTISPAGVNSGRISAIPVASPKSTRQGTPSPPTTMLAGQMSRCITPRRCIPATARANPSPSPTRSSTASGVATAARLRSPASANTSAPGSASCASCATPGTPRSRCSIASSWRSRRSESGPSSSLRMTVRPATTTRVTRVCGSSCTISARPAGSRPDRTPPDTIRHLHALPDPPHTVPTPIWRARPDKSRRNGILGRPRTRAPWRNLPDRYWPWVRRRP